MKSDQNQDLPERERLSKGETLYVTRAGDVLKSEALLGVNPSRAGNLSRSANPRKSNILTSIVPSLTLGAICIPEDAASGNQ